MSGEENACAEDHRFKVTMKPKFKDEHLVIVTANREVSMFHWGDYILEEWGRLMKDNTKLLVLAGPHGTEDGKVGSSDNRFISHSEKQKGRFKKKKGKYEERGIDIVIEDVSLYKDGETLNENMFAQKVKEVRPTVILIGICWSKHSQLNDILRSAGVYSSMIMREERAQVTESRHVWLDEQQEELKERISEGKERNLFLHSSSGCGKTVMLAEGLKTKVSQYKGQGREVIVKKNKKDTMDWTYGVMKKLDDVLGKADVLKSRMTSFPLYSSPPEPQMVLNHINLQLREKVSELPLTVNGKKAYRMFFLSEGHRKPQDEDQGCNTDSPAETNKQVRLPYKSFQSVRASGGGLSVTLINDKPWGKEGIVNVDFSKMQENSLIDFVELLTATSVCEDARETQRGAISDSDMDVQVEVTEGTINGYKFLKIERDSSMNKEKSQTRKGNQKKAESGDKQKGKVTNEQLDRWLRSLRHDDPDLTKKLKIIQGIKIKMSH